MEGCSPWGCWGSDTTERLHFHFSLSCIGEGNGNPLQCSCLENLRDGGAWWAAVYGVAQSRTWLKWLSSSNPSRRTRRREAGNPYLSCHGAEHVEAGLTGAGVCVCPASHKAGDCTLQHWELPTTAAGVLQLCGQGWSANIYFMMAWKLKLCTRNGKYNNIHQPSWLS